MRYGRGIRAVIPDREELEPLIQRRGVNGFYRSIEARQECCYVRKVAPLARALRESKAWITGLRADQSADRKRIALVEADTVHGVLKVSPMIDWTRNQAQAFAAANDVPTNPLHQQGFVSIGCAPCTRAIRLGEHERAGRWWWEQVQQKECGLHPHQKGELA